MANAVKARETIQVIRENPERFYMGLYVCGSVSPDAAHWSECKKTLCFAGWQCLLDGLRPSYWSNGRADGLFLDNGQLVGPRDHAMKSLELTETEADAVFMRTEITNIDDLEWVVEAVFAGDWAYCHSCDGGEGRGCEDCEWRGIIRPSEQV